MSRGVAIRIFTEGAEVRARLQRPAPLETLSWLQPTLAREDSNRATEPTPAEAVARILAEIAAEGEPAVRRWSQTLDGIAPKALKVPVDSMARALDELDPGLRLSLKLACMRIRRFHRAQPIESWTTHDLGGSLGQRLSPIRRVGIYAPGGSAPLPSSLLMAAIPAQVAGVEELVACTPPNPAPIMLAAAALCGLEEVYQIGGAQAIGAMAFGTENLRPVDKIVGAGNLYVTLAKQQVFGHVGIDGLAGPTETLIIADESAHPPWLAADLLAQAEHDPRASALLLTPNHPLAEAVQAEVEEQIASLSRREIIQQSLDAHGGILLVDDLEMAARLADGYAPEHLCLAVSEPRVLADRIRNAGGIFLGEWSYEVLGDYVAGPSHIMPTGGSARFSGPISVLDFIKITSLFGLDDETSRRLGGPAAELAEAEALTAHAAAARYRQEAADV